MDPSLPAVDVRALAAAAGERGLVDARAAAGRGDAAQAAAQFERLLSTLLFKEMRRGLSEGFFGAGTGADVYEGWLDEHLGNALSEGRGLGLRLALERELGGGAATEAEVSA